jgi:hypothetical protein
MPDPVSVIPLYRRQEAVFKTKGGVRRRALKGVWGGCKIKWILDPTGISLLEQLLAAEAADTDTTPFQLALDGATYMRAHLTQDPDLQPLKDTNVGLQVQLEFEFVSRSGYVTPIHLGAT